MPSPFATHRVDVLENQQVTTPTKARRPLWVAVRQLDCRHTPLSSSTGTNLGVRASGAVTDVFRFEGNPGLTEANRLRDTASGAIYRLAGLPYLSGGMGTLWACLAVMKTEDQGAGTPTV